MPDKQQEAKEGLTQALELDQTNANAWRDVGVVYYKGKEYEKCLEHYNKALELNPTDKKCLGYASILYRVIPAKGDEEKKENLNKGIELARQAVGFDIKDAHSWYLFGNSYMTAFFAMEKYDHLDSALKAYTQSEKLEVYQNPDLYNNRATIFTYFERYSEAIRDNMKAHSIDPGLNAKEKAQKICEYVIGTCRMIEQKKKVQSKKTIDLVKSLPKKIGEVKFLSLKETEQTLKYKVLPQVDCETGENLGVIFCAKVICQIHKDPAVPACFLVIDSKSTYSVVSIYNINKGIKDKIKFGDEILIRDPVLMFISIEYEARLLSYPCIRVITLSDLLVNEQTLADVYSKAEAVSGS